MKAVDTANERPDEALSFAVSTTFIRFSVDEWHLLKVGCLRGGGVFMAEAKPLSFSRTKCAETRVTSRSIPHHAHTHTQTHNPGRETDAQTTHDVNAKRTDARAKRNAGRQQGDHHKQFQSREHREGHARAAHSHAATQASTHACVAHAALRAGTPRRAESPANAPMRLPAWAANSAGERCPQTAASPCTACEARGLCPEPTKITRRRR